MTNDVLHQLRRGTSLEVAHALADVANPNLEELRAALVNTLERLAVLQAERDDVTHAIRWFNREMDRSNEP